MGRASDSAGRIFLNTGVFANWRLLVCLVAVTTPGCGDPTGSNTDPEPLSPNREVTGKVGARDTAWYRHSAGAGEAFSVLVSAVSGSVSLVVRDSTGREVAPRITASYSAPFVGKAETRLIVSRVASRFVLNVIGEGSYRIEILPNPTPPERAAPAIQVESTIDEAIDRNGDVDDFFLFGTPGDLFIAYVQTLNAAESNALRVLVTDSEGTGVAEASSTGNPTEIETQPSNRWTVSDSGAYRVRLQGPYQGAYRLKVRRVNPAPETAAPVARENDTTRTERLDYVGDIDEFTLRGPAGAEFNVMLRLVNDDPLARARADVIGAGTPSYSDHVESSGRDSLLADRATGRFALGASGAVTVRVEGVGLTRGFYELLGYRINRAPEVSHPSMSVPDSTTGESVELPGDIDEYTFDLASADTVTVVVRPVENGRGFRASIEDASRRTVAQTLHFGELAVTTEPTPLGPGRYTVAVSGSDAIDGAIGQYRLSIHRLRSSPESGPGTFAIGDTVTDAIDPAGDIDIFGFDARRGDYLDLRIQPLDGAGAGALSYFLRAPNQDPLAFGYFGTVAVSSLEELGSGRVTIAESGRHEVLVFSANGGRIASERGRYRMSVRRFPSAPERHGERLVPGDVVTDESTDQLGDIDEFSVEGQPGTEVAVYLTAASGPGGLRVEVLDATTKEVIAFTMSEGSFQSAGRVTLPANGKVLLRVGETRGSIPFFRTGGYRLEVPLINRAPENRPAVIAIGDTVSGESIDPVADVDEFSFAGVAGQRLVGLFDIPLGMNHPGLRLEIVAPGSGAILAIVDAVHPSDPFGGTKTAVFTLPASGIYRARIYVIDSHATAGAGYRFAVVPQ